MIYNNIIIWSNLVSLNTAWAASGSAWKLNSAHSDTFPMPWRSSQVPQLPWSKWVGEPDYGEGALIKAMINIYHIWWQIIIHDLYTNALERMGIAKKMNGAKSKHIGSKRWGQNKRWIRWKSAKTQMSLKIEIIMIWHISKLEYPGTPILRLNLIISTKRLKTW